MAKTKREPASLSAFVAWAQTINRVEDDLTKLERQTRLHASATLTDSLRRTRQALRSTRAALDGILQRAHPGATEQARGMFLADEIELESLAAQLQPPEPLSARRGRIRQMMGR